MRFATRTFLISFLPFAVLLIGSFWAVHKLVEWRVRDGLRDSLRNADISMSNVRKATEMQNNRFLRIVSENATLKAGVQLALQERQNAAARQTLEEQLRDICQSLNLDLLLVSDADRKPLAGVFRMHGSLLKMDLATMSPPSEGIFEFGHETNFQVTSLPINQADETLGLLSIGLKFDLLNDFKSTPTVLLHESKVLKSNLPQSIGNAEIEAALASCNSHPGCEEVELQGATYVTLHDDRVSLGGGYALQTLQSVDTVNGPVQRVLSWVFLAAGLGFILVALVISVASSRTIVQPLAGVVSTLHESAKTGLLPQFQTNRATIKEIRDLTESFNHAGAAIREAREKLQRAYVEFVGSLAGALDARDTYTAGHSRRVSEYSCSIAEAIGVSEAQMEEIRISALLHDIGKVGIADSVLRKPGRLTPEEFALLKQHPAIGRRILAGVAGFQPYLPVVELHHENWDGTGYPSGLCGEQTPLSARIVHVADAYDAMTSDRPYRPGLTHEAAVAELTKFAGTQFDPTIVSVFVNLPISTNTRRSEPPPSTASSGGLHIV